MKDHPVDVTATNRGGGIQGGISNGMPITLRVAFKPVATHFLPQKTVTTAPHVETVFQAKGRHDPCVGVRAGVTLESRMAIEVMDAALAHQSRQLSADNFRLF